MRIKGQKKGFREILVAGLLLCIMGFAQEGADNPNGVLPGEGDEGKRSATAEESGTPEVRSTAEAGESNNTFDKAFKEATQNLDREKAKALKEALGGDQKKLDALKEKCGEALEKCLEKTSPGDMSAAIEAIQKEDQALFEIYDGLRGRPHDEMTAEEKAAKAELQRRAERFPGVKAVMGSGSEKKGDPIDAYRRFKRLTDPDVIKDPKKFEEASQSVARLVGSMDPKSRAKLLDDLKNSKHPNLEALTATVDLAEQMRTKGDASGFSNSFFDQNKNLKDSAVKVANDQVAYQKEFNVAMKAAAEGNTKPMDDFKLKYGLDPNEHLIHRSAAGEDVATKALQKSAARDENGNLILSSRVVDRDLKGDTSPNGKRGVVNLVVRDDEEAVKAAAKELVSDRFQGNQLIDAKSAADLRGKINEYLKEHPEASVEDAVEALSKNETLQKERKLDQTSLKKELGAAGKGSYLGTMKNGKLHWDAYPERGVKGQAPVDPSDPKTHIDPDGPKGKSKAAENGGKADPTPSQKPDPKQVGHNKLAEEQRKKDEQKRQEEERENRLKRAKPEEKAAVGKRVDREKAINEREKALKDLNEKYERERDPKEREKLNSKIVAEKYEILAAKHSLKMDDYDEKIQKARGASKETDQALLLAKEKQAYHNLYLAQRELEQAKWGERNGDENAKESVKKASKALAAAQKSYQQAQDTTYESRDQDGNKVQRQIGELEREYRSLETQIRSIELQRHGVGERTKAGEELKAQIIELKSQVTRLKSQVTNLKNKQ
ncbi:MAG: hypothetical protein HYR96_09360 [Deltaproteobacteria bacterium]|nr:hypothetical protein [Deltaproteobacteria bacterium]MBI3296163.1 hypothetical protein [Deltaproteobacteria bacterium]